MNRVPVMEVFGPTIQGEGPMIGKKVMFVRTGGCDYSCAWCDSAFTWDGQEKAVLMSPKEVLDKLVQVGGKSFNTITISGGNPLLIGDPMEEFIDLAHAAGYHLSVETQGSKWQSWLSKVDDIVLSPKPPSSGMQTNMPMLQDIMGRLLGVSNTAVALKIVVFDNADYNYAGDMRERFPDVPFYLQVGNPEFSEPDDHKLRAVLLERYQWLINLVLADEKMNDAIVLPQLHALLWGNKRAV